MFCAYQWTSSNDADSFGWYRKTQLATQYGYDRKARRPNTSTFWVSARSEEELHFGFEAIAVKLDLRRRFPGRFKLTDGVLPMLKEWMLSPQSGDWLMILDNYDDIQGINFDSFIPAEATGGVLITTRDRKIVGPIATSGLHLTAMDESDAKLLFLRLSGTTSSIISQDSHPSYDGQSLKEILRELQYFPLAIDQAASFIRENSPMTFQEYLRHLEPRSVDREKLMRFKQVRPDYPESVMTTWEG